MSARRPREPKPIAHQSDPYFNFVGTDVGINYSQPTAGMQGPYSSYRAPGLCCPMCAQTCSGIEEYARAGIVGGFGGMSAMAAYQGIEEAKRMYNKK